MDPVVATVQEMDANASSAPAAESAQTGQPAAAPLPDPAAPDDSELLTRRTRRVSIAEGSNKGFEQKAPLRVFELERVNVKLKGVNVLEQLFSAECYIEMRVRGGQVSANLGRLKPRTSRL